MENKYSNMSLMDGYVKRMQERIDTTPEMMVNKEEKYMIIRNNDENLIKFDNLLSQMEQEIPEDFKVYLNDPEDYDKISEGVFLRHELNEERKRQERIQNPQIDEDIKSINSKNKLFDFLLKEFYNNKEMIMDEFSGKTYEEDVALLNAEYNELVKLKEKYIN